MDRDQQKVDQCTECGAGGNMKGATLSLYFDGTGNNLNVDRIQRKLTNVSRLFLLANKASNHHSTYIHGIGTPLGGRRHSSIYQAVRDSLVLGGGLGLGGGERLRHASLAVEQFLSQDANRPHKRINLFGFSRGAALARHFTNILANGVSVVAEGTTRTFTAVPFISGNPDHFVIDFVGLFDTVGSLYFPGTDIDLHYNLDIPPVVNRVFHIVAAHERRRMFDLQSIRTDSDAPLPSNWEEVVLPGVHSDIGGGYTPYDPSEEEFKDPNLAVHALHIMHEKAVAAGVPLVPLDRASVTKSGLAYDLYCRKSPEVSSYLADYDAVLEKRASLQAQIERHEALYYRWLKHCIDYNGWPLAPQSLVSGKQDLEGDTRKSLLKAEKELRQAIRSLLDEKKESLSKAHPEFTDDECEIGAWNALADHILHRELEAVLDDLASLENGTLAYPPLGRYTDRWFIHLRESFRSIEYRLAVERGKSTIGLPPILSVKGKRTENPPRLRPLTARERTVYRWMTADSPLPVGARLLFDRYVHDSVADFKDPLDRHLAARRLYYQNAYRTEEAVA